VKYSALTRQYFDGAPDAGELDPTTAGRCAAGDPSQGAWVQFDIRAACGRIEAARFRAFGCPHTIAVASWLASSAPQLPLVPALPEPVRVIQQRFEVPVEKLGRILLVEDAWCGAIRAAITKSGSGMV
jgi:hypothetical protein